MLDKFHSTADIFAKLRTSKDKYYDTSKENEEKFEIWKEAIYITKKKETKQSEEILKLLLDCDVVYCLEAAIGHTILHKIIGNSLETDDKKRRLIKVFLQSGNINANVKDLDGRTVLHLVKEQTLGSLLIRYGADVNNKDKEGKTPLISVCQ